MEDYQLGIVDIIEATTEMQKHEDDPERQEYLQRIHDYADAYLETFETDTELYLR